MTNNTADWTKIFTLNVVVALWETERAEKAAVLKKNPPKLGKGFWKAARRTYGY